MASDKQIIQQLIKIATKQQAVLNKLAQEVVADPNIDYLRRAAQVAAMNTGFATTTVEASKMPGSSEGTVSITESYTVKITGAPKNNVVRQKFIDTFKTQVQMQKPELVPGLSIIFGD